MSIRSGSCSQAGTNRHEDICESIELFGKSVIPRFAERREASERAKAKRLAPAIEQAVARRTPARVASGAYRIDEEAEVERARRSRRAARLKPRELLRSARAEARTSVRRRAQRALGRFARDRSDEHIERRFGTTAAQGAIFRGMARSFEPKMSFGFEGEIQFELTTPATGAASRTWTIEVRDGRARARSGVANEPRVSIRVGVADFVRITAGEENGAALLLAGKLQMDGDFTIAPRLAEMFGGPSPY